MKVANCRVGQQVRLTGVDHWFDDPRRGKVDSEPFRSNGTTYSVYVQWSHGPCTAHPVSRLELDPTLQTQEAIA